MNYVVNERKGEFKFFLGALNPQDAAQLIREFLATQDSEYKKRFIHALLHDPNKHDPTVWNIAWDLLHYG